MNPNNGTPTNIEIQLGDDCAQGVYSNLAIINHSSSDIIVDYVFLQPNAPKGKVMSRVIMSAENAKRFALALQDNIQKYESKFGEIVLHQNI